MTSGTAKSLASKPRLTLRLCVRLILWEQENMKIFVGTGGYGYKEWKGKFYPEKISPKEMLRFYAEHLTAVEINNTFYHMPTEAVLTSWAEQVPDDFVSALKAPQVITHLTSDDGGFDAMEEDPGDGQAHPDDEAKQTHQIHHGQTPDALLPELLEIGDHADGEKGHGEEDLPENVCSPWWPFWRS